MIHWMFSCKDVSQKVSVAMDAPLPVRHRLAIRMHLLMCRHCSRFRRQLMMLRHLSRYAVSDPSAADPPATLSSEARERIKKALRAAY
jgi:hypothetical protein